MKIKKYQNSPGPISRATDEYYNGTGWHFVKGSLLRPSDPNYSVAQRKGLDKSYLVDKDGVLVPEKVRSAYEQNKLYQAQLPHQEQNDINDARLIQKQQADRFVALEYNTPHVLNTMILEPTKIAIPSLVWGAATTDQAKGFEDRFRYVFSPSNRGFFETNDYTRQAYDQDPVGGTILNLAGDIVVPTALVHPIPKTTISNNTSKLLGNIEMPNKHINLIKPINQMTREEKIQYLAKTKELAQRVDLARNLDALRMVKDRLRQGGFKRIRKAYMEDINFIPEESKIFHPQNKMIMQSLDLANESKILNEKPIRGTAKQLSQELSRRNGSYISFNKNTGGKGGTGIGYTTIPSDGLLKFQGLKKRLKGAAHEFVHWLYWPASRPKGLNSSILDDSMLRYLLGRNPEVGSGEIIARGTELKNYFGLKEGEQLTPEMWDYAKRHYLIDVAPNNGTAALFNAVDTKSKDFPLFLLWLNRRAPIVTGLTIGGAKIYNNSDNK